MTDVVDRITPSKPLHPIATGFYEGDPFEPGAGGTVEILAIDTHPTQYRDSCWIRTIPEGRSAVMYRSTDLCEITDIKLVSPELHHDVIDEDFHQASRYYASLAFGNGTKDQYFEKLKKDYEEDERLDPLTWLFCQHRNRKPDVPEGFKLVPIDPSEEMWDGLARHIINWLGNGSRLKTPNDLFLYLACVGQEVPKWLSKEFETCDLDKAVNRGTRAVIVYRAMLEDHKKHDDAHHEAIFKAIMQSSKEVSKPVFVKDPPKCTCLSELQDDAYEPGGPSSGHKRPPPCELHSGK